MPGDVSQVGIWLNLEQFSLLSLNQFLMGGAVVLLGFSLGGGLALLFRRPLAQVSHVTSPTGIMPPWSKTLIISPCQSGCLEDLGRPV